MGSAKSALYLENQKAVMMHARRLRAPGSIRKKVSAMLGKNVLPHYKEGDDLVQS